MKNRYIKIINITFITIILIILYLSSLYNYLLFHTIAEIFSVCIAFTIFVLTWNSNSYLKNNYLILIGISYFFIGVIDLFHTMSYKGMQIFKGYDYYANQLWIAARYFESTMLLISFIYIKSKKKVNIYITFTICTIFTTLIMLSIFAWKIFPICFVEGIGLTPFKKYSEYIICIILMTAIVVLTKNKDTFEGKVYRFIFLSMVCTIISEFAFTIYIDNYGLSNLVGHYFKIFSFYLIYKSIIVKGIQEPYEVIFREMKITEQKLFEHNCILKDQATVDGLTGLFNHRHLYECLEEEAKICSSIDSTFVVMLLDIDHFKNINDTWGHIIGDKILKELSQVLKENVRSNDIVGRYGGEEFLIKLTETNLNKAFEFAEKIRQAIELKEFTEGIHLTVSIGIEIYKGESISELVGKADNKLYIAKNSGRNKTVM
ncbi:MASE3 domain-containing protein [Clostridium thailandense]|uniref:sensor domain-containing diguanylate cyclase n=1 Tax=Clostridium thailandense TaxID=2794346 RepID=UPI003988C79F